MTDLHDSVSARVAAVHAMPMADLWKLWDHYFPSRPSRPNRRHLQSRLIYKIQEEVHGPLPSRLREQLVAIGESHSKIKRRAKAQEFHFAPGTVLIREWGEAEHRVQVTADGQFAYGGRTFKSLTAVARTITGSHLSGPHFFGLKRRPA